MPGGAEEWRMRGTISLFSDTSISTHRLHGQPVLLVVSVIDDRVDMVYQVGTA
ncbi:MAG: hypothetical protein AVDCRST_MAG27-3351 [uncultured Craurococcus sp.]|uniref:Uncharacterized protein n=1 Tax=uncultured Craurococcus sp. TaxID=1135998 RepID=A0A6J4J091_9PROT|nr:MAG: hypothetical protein AVDCRST_MAG27-3351 [uncultured Craurococcus sp.]